MSAGKHTPGPWRVERDGPNRQWLINSEDFGVATCDGPFRNQEADARLIAAAPDQHEACKVSLLVLCALRNANDWHPNMLKDIDCAIEANRAAIAKVTGEQV